MPDIDECDESYAANRTHLESFGCWYSNIHGYMSLCVCIFGVVANLINIIILTRKNMRTSTNCILTGLAVSDMLTMSSYAPFVYHFHLAYGTEDSAERNTHDWIAFKVFNALFTATTHTVSIWLGVVLAIFRFVFIRLSTEGQTTCSIPRAKIAVISVYACAMIICIPNYCSISMIEYNNTDTNETYYILQSLNTTSGFIMGLNLWTYAILAKIVPCCLMALFGGLLLLSLSEVKKKGELLHQNTRISDSYRARMQEHGRTTKMLVTVITLFLLTELPQGVLLVICILVPPVFKSVYSPLGDLMDDIALINNGINLIIYCTMSKSFRENCLWFMCRCWKKKNKFLMMRKSRETQSTLL